MSQMKFQRTRVFDVDIAHPLPDILEMQGYEYAHILVRWETRTLCTLHLPCPNGILRGQAIRDAVATDGYAGWLISDRAIRRWLLGPDALASPATQPSWSVIVCTRDRPVDLRRCLGALMALESAPGGACGEIVVVDNAPATDAAERVVLEYQAIVQQQGKPALRYVREERPGLNWARACGARAASGEIVAYTDDDVVVDRHWITRILEPFADGRVGAVTGLTMPFEIETESQWLFERYGGFGRGLRRRVFDANWFRATDAGAAGAGANMALRRALVVDGQLFEVELDAGTVTRTGGDTYAMYRLLVEGYQVIYTPDAIVWHKHRREYGPLRDTLYGYSVGGFAYLTRCLVSHGDLRALGSMVTWIRTDHARHLYRLLRRRPHALPRDLVLAYWKGVFIGPFAYLRSRRTERRHRAMDAALRRTLAPPGLSGTDSPLQPELHAETSP
ncbi:MAG: glycosyltransferase family 2 protein [bacterium]